MAERFIKLTKFTLKGNIYLNPATTVLEEIAEVQKDDNNPRRTRITTTKNTLLVVEPADVVARFFGIIGEG